MISVLVVDDEPLVRRAISSILRPRAGFAVVGECDDCAQVAAAVADLEPDVVLLDLRMKGMRAGQVIRSLSCAGHETPLLALASFDDGDLVADALVAGARGIQMRTCTAGDLLKSVSIVAAGGSWLDPAVCPQIIEVYRLAKGRQQSAEAAIGELTTRESEVLARMARGESNSEIAEHLFVGAGTIKTHVSNILTKLDVRDRVGAAIVGVDAGFGHFD